MTMRALPSPWLSSASPDLHSTIGSSTTAPVPSLTEADEKELMRPKHMSESYTQFELPLASDPRLFERYVNAQGGFRGSHYLELADLY